VEEEKLGFLQGDATSCFSERRRRHKTPDLGERPLLGLNWAVVMGFERWVLCELKSPLRTNWPRWRPRRPDGGPNRPNYVSTLLMTSFGVICAIVMGKCGVM
jgi:hypothetical protein